MENTAPLASVAVLLGCIVGIGGVLAAVLVYIAQIQVTLNRFAPGHRKMQGGLAWLMLVPFFGCYWQFRVNSALAESSKAEFRSGGIQLERMYPKGPGIAKAVLDILAVLTLVGTLVALSAPSDPVTLDYYNPAWDVVVGVCGIGYGAFQIAAVVLWIVMWVKMNRLRKCLAARIGPRDFAPTPGPIPAPGAPGPPPRYCSNCGVPLGPGRYCMQCGKGT